MEVVIAHTRGGMELGRYSPTFYRLNCSSWSCLPWTWVNPVQLSFPGVQKGDRIVVSGRSLTASEGYPQHGWTTLGDDLVFSYSCRPVEIELGEPRFDLGRDAAFYVLVRQLAEEPSFTWLRDGQPIDINDPRYVIAHSATTSQLYISHSVEEEVGTYSCLVQSACGSTEIVAGRIEYCLADYNRDAAVDGDDVIAFFGDWDTNSLDADVDRSDGVDGDDVIRFFEQWDIGC